MVPRQSRPKRFVDANSEYPLTPETEAFVDELETSFGFRAYPWQAHAIQSLREGHDVLIRIGTAGGKSFPYQAMALTKPNAIVVVISPLIALMENQVHYSKRNSS